MREGLLLFSLADHLGVDIDVVRTWPLAKVLAWKHYFEIKAETLREQIDAGKQKGHSDGGVHIRRRGGRMVMD